MIKAELAIEKCSIFLSMDVLLPGIPRANDIVAITDNTLDKFIDKIMSEPEFIEDVFRNYLKESSKGLSKDQIVERLELLGDACYVTRVFFWENQDYVTIFLSDEKISD
jgi:hypothetical protein